MLGWCEAIARNPHRIPNNTRTPEISGDLADASQTSTLNDKSPGRSASRSSNISKASSPTTGTAPRSQSRLSVCPSTQDICRSAILHDMSEDAFEQCTPVMGLSPARRESGKKSVKQRPRRRRRASERYEHAEAQIRGRRKDFHLQITSPRGSERYTDSSDSSSTDETHWIQAKRRAQVQFRRSRRRRRNSHKPCGNADASCAPNGMALVDVQPEGKKQQELTECESCSLKLCRGKGTRYQECSLSLPTGAFEMKRASRQREEGKYQPRDLQPSHRLGHYETIQKRLSEADSSTDILAGAEGGKYADAAGFQDLSLRRRRGEPSHHPLSLHRHPALCPPVLPPPVDQELRHALLRALQV
eukprot:XP_022259270.1 E3 ubiquitin-protein ligase MARCH1 isoform X1 [Canis lupus familiaris]